MARAGPRPDIQHPVGVVVAGADSPQPRRPAGRRRERAPAHLSPLLCCSGRNPTRGCKQTEVGILSRTVRPTSPGELAAVLSALAGMRKGDAVAAVAAGRVTRACLAAGTGRDLLDDDAGDGSARVVVVEEPAELKAALRLLAPGGRIVSLAADAEAAKQ